MVRITPKIIVYTLLLTSLFLLPSLTSCQEDSHVPEITPSFETAETITVMTYNILAGAGTDVVGSGWKEHAVERGYPGNRLERVLEVIKAADPDILGIQEATYWDRGNPSLAQQVADELDMNYVIGESKNAGLHVILFTKFDVIKSESYPQPPFTRAALRVELLMPRGTHVQVFVTHLDSANRETRISELSFLSEELRLYEDDLAILIGDMNFRPFTLYVVCKSGAI